MLRAVMAFLLAAGQAAALTAPPIRELAPNTYLLPGTVPTDRGPDGNTVIFTAPSGLIVVDTGRHRWHSDAILEFARSRKQPVTAIVNTHWHLDHSSGNVRLLAAHPKAQIYASRAVDRALAPDGFLSRNLAATTKRPPAADPIRREETEIFITTMETPNALRPTVAVDKSATRTIAGRSLSVRIANDAVTDADVWLYDEATGVAVIGDLVTLPAPFFETACPAKWQAALDEVWATPFRTAIPGHGEPMTREAFDSYRKAFAHFRACVGSEQQAGACSQGWVKDVSSLLASADRLQAAEFATYYVDFLRKGGGSSPDCRAK